jgi:glycopeptide antibiotics resistance protein
VKGADPVARSVRKPLTRRHYAGLSLGLALFIVYGSLLPFNYQPLPWAETLSRFRVVCSAPVRLGSGADWLANVLLVLPLGYLFMGMLAADRSVPLRFLAAALVLPTCLALSVAVEFSQLWFPPRVSSLDDIVAQSVGAGIGTGVWLVAGQRITRWVRRVWLTAGTKGLGARVLPGYLALLGFLYGMPFDLTLHPRDLYHKWRDGRIRLVPFVAHDVTVFQMVEKYCWTAALFLPLGVLLASIRHGAWQNARSWWRVLAVALAATSLIQVLKLFVVSRYVDATEVVIGSLAVLVGWALALTLRQQRVAAIASGPGPGVSAPRPTHKALRGLLLLTWLAAAVFVNWQPFNFTLDSQFAAERLSRLSVVPFVDYYRDAYLNAFDQFVHKVLLFVPLGALLTLMFHPTRWGRGSLVLLTAAVVAAGLEAGQLFLPSRYPSVTDVLVESSGAWLGLVVTRRARSLLASAPLPEIPQAAA